MFIELCNIAILRNTAGQRLAEIQVQAKQVTDLGA